MVDILCGGNFVKKSTITCLVAILCLSSVQSFGQEGKNPLPIVGRWDLTIHDPKGDYPSWLEVTLSGYKTFVGRFVARFGSSRPIGEVIVTAGHVKFSLPVQWERQKGDIFYEGDLRGNRLEGTTKTEKGVAVKWSGVRAPTLARSASPQWGQEVDLFNHKDTSGWTGRGGAKHGWVVENGVLVNKKPGVDIVTTRKFNDFKVYAEFRYPRESNSGIYLRGRYEAQIEDNYGMPPDSHGIGGIYGFLIPRINACKPAGEWQTYDITLVGRTVTVTLNRETVIDRQEIPGITGGALDSNEGAAGPLLIQGDHGRVEFRSIKITPAK
jgi:hypothetical protein